MRHQEPSSPNKWLYKDFGENNRMYVIAVDLPDEAPLWDECTDEEKTEWENIAHPVSNDEPEDVQNEEPDVEII